MVMMLRSWHCRNLLPESKNTTFYAEIRLSFDRGERFTKALSDGRVGSMDVGKESELLENPCLSYSLLATRRSLLLLTISIRTCQPHNPLRPGNLGCPWTR
jgi:hypothetical protein